MSHSVTCPHCGTTYNVTRNTQYKCSGCGARITVGNDGNIKSTSPKK